MKLLTSLLLILFFSVSSMAQEPEVIDCVVAKPTVVVCEVSENQTRGFVVGSVRDWNAPRFSEWLLASEHWNKPLIKAPLRVGQKLKAKVDENGHLVPVASCEVRIHRRVAEWSKNHPGDRVPLSVVELPKDCKK